MLRTVKDTAEFGALYAGKKCRFIGCVVMWDALTKCIDCSDAESCELNLYEQTTYGESYVCLNDKYCDMERGDVVEFVDEWKDKSINKMKKYATHVISKTFEI